MVGHVGATGQTYYSPDVTVDPHYRVSEESTRSEVDIPLKAHGRLIGVFNAQHHEVNAFSPGRIQLLEALAGHIAIAIENARMFQRERSENERLQKDLRDARRIQQALFPVEPPSTPGFTVNGLCLPCLAVGGDWYDYIPLGGGRLAVVLGDVAGKGMGAALLMSSTRTVVRHVVETEVPPGEVLSRVNTILIRDLPAARFVTMIYALLDPPAGTLTFANAGHPYPLLVRSGDSRFVITETGWPLGIQDGSYVERVVPMSPDDRFIMVSDGVTEAISSEAQQYGEERLFKHFADPLAGAQSLLDDVRSFTADHPASDDITIVEIHRDRANDDPEQPPAPDIFTREMI